MLQGGWPLFYIEWGWCWWTRNRLILKIWWLLECSFWHCWHSYLRTWSNVLRHRKTTPELWRAKEWRFYKGILSRSTPCGRLFLFYSQYSIFVTNIQGKSSGRHCLILPAMHKIRPIIQREDKWLKRGKRSEKSGRRMAAMLLRLETTMPAAFIFLSDVYYSSVSAASFSSLMIGRCCGHTLSHCLQPMQSLAFPESAPIRLL